MNLVILLKQLANTYKVTFDSWMYNTSLIKESLPSILMIKTSLIPSIDRVVSFGNFTLFFMVQLILANQSFLPVIWVKYPEFKYNSSIHLTHSLTVTMIFSSACNWLMLSYNRLQPVFVAFLELLLLLSHSLLLMHACHTPKFAR